MAIFTSELSSSILNLSSSVGSSTASLHVEGSGSSVVAIDGTQGRLFSVSDELSGSLFSANTIAGLPVIEAFSDNKVTLGPFAKQIIIDTAGNISGSLTSTGSFGTIRVGSVVGSLPSGLVFGDGNTGFYENTDNVLYVTINGTDRLQFNGGSLLSLVSGGPGFYGEAASDTNPTLVPDNTDNNTGVGQASADNLSLIAGGAEILRLAANTISGSITSTGSFGAGFFDDSVGIGVAPGNSSYMLNIEAAHTYAARFKSRKSTSSSSQRTMIQVGSGQTKGAGIFFDGPTNSNGHYTIGVNEDQVFHIAPGLADIGDSSSNSVTVDTSGNLEVLSGNISGSITSTGSFGKVDLASEGVFRGMSISGSRFSTGSFGRLQSNTFVGSLVGSQEHITTIKNTALRVGRDDDNQIQFIYDDAILFRVAGGLDVSFESNGRIKAKQLLGNNLALVSGSITSTGSFGSLVVSDKVQGDLTVVGNVVAEQYIISSSVTHLTQSFSSGSTIFGDSLNDDHEFTGSVDITGSISMANSPIFMKSFSGHNRGRILFDGSMTIDNADDTARPIKITTGQGTAASGKDTAIIRIAPSGSTSGYFNAHGGVSIGRKHYRADSSTSTDFTLHISESADAGLLKIEGSKISGSVSSTGSFGSLVIADKVQGDLTVDGNIQSTSGDNLSIGTSWSPAGTYGVGRFHGAHNGGGTRVMFSNDNSSVRYGIVMHGSDTGTADKLGIGLLLNENATYANASPAMTIDSSKNIGMGTQSPSTKLHIFSSGNGGLEIDATGGAPTLFFDIPGNEQGRIYFQEDDTLLGGIVYETTSTDYLSFRVGGSSANVERLRITGDNKISGSIVSTGSFGRVESRGAYYGIGSKSESGYITGSNHEIVIAARSSGMDSSQIILKGRASGDGASRGEIVFRTATHQHYINGPKDAVTINLSGSVELHRGNLSGSITSTGSFGNVFVDKALEIGNGITVSSGNVSGSSSSTGSFGRVFVDGGNIATVGNMILDADGAQIRFQDGGTEFGRISRVSSDLVIKSISNNNDILFKGVDGGGTITALQLDMSEGGNAIFSGNVSGSSTSTGSFGALVVADKVQGNFTVGGQLYLGASNQLRIYSEGQGGSDNMVILAKLNDLRIVNQHHGGNIRFEVENSSGTAIEAMRIDGDGKIGIGTASPAVQFHLSSSSANNFRIERSGTTNAAIHFKNASDDWYAGITSQQDFSISQNADIASGTEFRIQDSTGNVGIGTDNPSSLLHLNASTADLLIQDSDGTNQTLTIQHSGANTFMTSRNGSSHGAFFFRTYNGSTFKTALSIDSNSNIEFANASTISGSATSTGSFGRVQASDRIIGRLVDNVGFQSLSGLNTFKDGATQYALLGSGNQIGVAGNADDFNLKAVDGIHLSTNNNNDSNLTILSSGNVGIGTESPNFPLNVHTTASNVTLASFHGTGNTDLNTPVGITFGTRTDTGSGTTDQRAGIFYKYNGRIFIAAKTGVGDLNTSPEQYSMLYVDGAQAGGRVGIGQGVTSPAQTLDVSGSAIIRGDLTSTATILSTGTAPVLRLQETDASDNFEIFEIQSSGGSVNFNTRNSAGTFVSTDYQKTTNSNGASLHRWFIAGTQRLYLDATKISGSIQSTGSFGSVRLGETFELAENSDTFTLKDLANSRTYFSATTGAVITIGQNYGANISLNTSAGVVIPNGTGLNVQSGNISGSLTSTGSFGALSIGNSGETGTNNTVYVDGIARVGGLRIQDEFIGVNNSNLYYTDGNLGIGTTAPSALLHLEAGSDNATGGIRLTNDDTGQGSTDGTALFIEQNTKDFFIRNYEDAGIRMRSNDITRLYVTATQNVGIGNFSESNLPDAHLNISSSVGSSTASLHIEGSGSSVVAIDGTQGRLFTVTDELSGSLFSANTIAGLPVIEAFSDNKVTLGPFAKQIIVDGSGNISGSLTSTGSFGRVNSLTGFFEAGSKISDYVFESDYKLRTLEEVESHISSSKHLPGIPSEAEIEKWRDLSMGDRDRLLLEKIEELTLYVIELNKEIKKLKNNR